MSETVNPLAGLSKAAFADHFGEVHSRLKQGDAELEACKAEFDRRKYDFAKGERFKVTKDTQTQTRLDMKALREGLGAAALKPYDKTSPRTLYLVRPVEAA